MGSEAGHTPVLLREAVDFLNVRSAGAYLDATGGLGGHSREILKGLSPAGRLVVCDYHAPTAENLHNDFQGNLNVTVVNERFSQIFEREQGPFDGILADFGISSVQLADETLGIGFLAENAPLDMRIDSSLTTTACEILETYDEADLADLFFHLGGERASRKIAAAVVYDRERDKFYRTAGEFKSLCERVLGKFYRGARIHPATKVFQALRIAVNRELEEIAALLNTAPQRLLAGGRLVLISFHEGEDGLVKRKFRELAETGNYRLITKKAIKPDDNEIAANPRARSARLRVLERVS